MKTVFREIRTDSRTIIGGLRHALRYIKGSEHDDFCSSVEKKFTMCDCGKVLAAEQVQSAIKRFTHGRQDASEIEYMNKKYQPLPPCPVHGDPCRCTP